MTMSPEADEIDAVFNGIISGLDRDQYERPLLVPGGDYEMPLKPRGKRTDGKLPYTRASALANYVSDHTALHTWQMRSLTKGLSEREDLAAKGASLPPIIGNGRDKSTMSKQETLQDKLTNAVLDEIAEEAMIYANRDFKANWGTAIHGFTDPGEHGQVPMRMVADVGSWEECILGWEFGGTEMFVRNDEYQSAGTFDHVIRIPWRPDLGWIIVDKKTGLLHADQFSVQLPVYARGEPYDVVDNVTYPWPMGERPNQKLALIAHIPLGTGRTILYEVDLVAGHAAALTACAVRAHRMNKALMTKVDYRAEAQDHVASLLSIADCRATLVAIAQEWKPVWDENLKAVARQRLAVLEAA